MIVDIYQTVEYRPYSPFRGVAVPAVEDCWLGKGYYFWEVFIQNAHDWGKRFYTIKQKRYEIFKTQYDNASDFCLNLLDPVQRMDFNQDLEEIFKSCDESLKFIGASFELLKKVFPEEYEKYECVRDWPQGGLNSGTLPYNIKDGGRQEGRYFINMPIQVCFWSKPPKRLKSVFVSK